jgi:alkylhydroperoxidase family enzyme
VAELVRDRVDPRGRVNSGYGERVARLPLVDGSDPGADPLARELLTALAGGRPFQPNVYRAVANHPRALQKMVEFGTVVDFQNSLSPAQRELAYLTASVTNDCHY